MAVKNNEFNISVVIPTLNAEKFLPGLFGMLNAQTLPPGEIIVIDSSSADNTINIARDSGCKVTVIPKSQFDHGGTRNLGVKQSTGNIVVFMTQDALPVNAYLLENLTKCFADSMTGAAFARQVPRHDADPIEYFTRNFNYPETSQLKQKNDIEKLGIKTFFFSDVCSAVRKEAFYKVGCFPEKIILNEDMCLAASMILNGYAIAYSGDAQVWHSHDYTVSEQFRRNFDIGVSFNRNRWILEYARAEIEGYKYFESQLSYLAKNRHFRWIPYAIWLTIAKYFGYMLGMNESKLPLHIKRKLSMHKFFWNEV
ncbi:MAG TPA: glycosyltransferase [Syntrophomonadaceae bacterium]|nr:glycosyltransferase [Syntrophomonadaceae bacterium]HPR92763.1 glycosyltransferase [Syntrophomonadaceae bacterium]